MVHLPIRHLRVSSTCIQPVTSSRSRRPHVLHSCDWSMLHDVRQASAPTGVGPRRGAASITRSPRASRRPPGNREPRSSRDQVGVAGSPQCHVGLLGIAMAENLQPGPSPHRRRGYPQVRRAGIGGADQPAEHDGADDESSSDRCGPAQLRPGAEWTSAEIARRHSRVRTGAHPSAMMRP